MLGLNSYHHGTIISRLIVIFVFLTTGPLQFAADPLEEFRGGRANWARLKFQVEGGGWKDWTNMPEGDVRLIKQMRGLSSVNVDYQWHVADIEKLEEMCAFPLIFMHAEHQPILNDAHLDNLRQYLLRGGFLYMDDCRLGQAPDLFVRKMKELMPKILPGSKVELLTKDHELFRAYFQLNHFFVSFKDQGKQVSEGKYEILPEGKPAMLWGLPEMEKAGYMFYGVMHQGRMVAVITATDLHCHWSGLYAAAKAEESFRFAINIYVYAMTH